MKSKEINTVDLFCGAGGATTGLELALKRLGMKHKGLAINHWQIAVDTMKENHPDVFPMLEDGRVIDIRIRMLKPSELAAAHSFPSDYVLTGNRGEQVKQIGNSVPVMTAAAMCESDFLQTSKKGA